MNEMVSIIIPCYNQEKYLAETLDSVIAQTSGTWECIIVNDGSTDNSEAIIDAYCTKDFRFTKLNQENQGLAASRNNGIKEARGKYILPLDGDDKIGTQYIELAQKEFEKNPKLTLVYCKAEFFGAKTGSWDLRKYDYDTLLFVNHIFCSGIFKKEDYLKTSGYDTNMIFGYEDWEFWIQLLKKGDDVVQLDSVQFFYRQRESSMIKSLHESKSQQNQMEWYIFNKHRDLYAQILDSDLSLADIQNVFQTRQTFKKIKRTLTYKTIYKVERAIRSLF